MTPHKTLAVLAVVVVALAAAPNQAAFAARSAQQIGRPPQMPPLGRDPGLPGPMAKGTASLAGTVTSTTGKPLRRASVRVQGANGGPSRATITDDRGNFELKELPAGEFLLRASKPGYLESIYGQKNPGSGRPGTAVSLAEGQRIEKLELQIPKGGVITGTIVDDLGEPVFGVPVRIMKYQMRNGERVLVSAGNGSTDDRGVYRIPTLNPGDYIVMATPRSDAGASNDMAAVEQALSSAGAAGGVVAGNAFARVNLPSSNTDDVPSTGYAPVFYPGNMLASAAMPVALGPAEEKNAIDIQLQLVPLGTITGTIVGDPRAIQATTVQLNDANTGVPGLVARTARPDAAGKFTFTGVAPGQYSVTAKSGGSTQVFASDGGERVMMFMQTVRDSSGGSSNEPPPPSMWAKTETSVDGRSKTELTLVLQPGLSVSGRVAFDGTGEPPTDLTQIRLILGNTANGIFSGSSMATVNADGTFKLNDVLPGKYRLTSTAPRGWRAKSVDVAGLDALDTLLEVKSTDDVPNVTVTYTNRPTELSGTLSDASGAATSAYTIVLFAADQRFWTPQSRRILSTRPATDGKFTFRDLPPGDYKLAALDDAEPGIWFDPNFLKQLMGSAISVKVTEGAKGIQDIRVGK